MRWFAKNASSSSRKLGIDEKTLSSMAQTVSKMKPPPGGISPVTKECNEMLMAMENLFQDETKKEFRMKFPIQSWAENNKEARNLVFRALELVKLNQGLDISHIAYAYLSRALFSLPFWPPEDALQLLNKMQIQSLDMSPVEAVHLALDTVERMAVQLRVAARYHKEQRTGIWRWRPILRVVTFVSIQEAATYQYDPNGIEGIPM